MAILAGGGGGGGGGFMAMFGQYSSVVYLTVVGIHVVRVIRVSVREHRNGTARSVRSVLVDELEHLDHPPGRIEPRNVETDE